MIRKQVPLVQNVGLSLPTTYIVRGKVIFSQVSLQKQQGLQAMLSVAL